MNKRTFLRTRDFFRSMSKLFFISNALFGALLLSMLLLFNPYLFFCGLFSALVGQWHSVRYQTPKAISVSGIIQVNGLFLGLALGSLFEPTVGFFAFLGVASFVQPLVSKAMFEVLQHWRLSPYVAPYVATTWVIWIVKDRFGLIALRPDFPDRLDIPFGEIISEPFLSASRLIFYPSVGLGALLFLLLAIFDLKKSLHFILGSVAATFVAYSVSDSIGVWGFGTLSFCGGLTAVCLSSSPEKFRPHSIAMFAGISTVITLVCETSLLRTGLPVLSLPFALTVWLAQLSHMPRSNVRLAPIGTHRKQKLELSNPIFTGEEFVSRHTNVAMRA